LLTNEELEAVIAHELGHRFHRNRHISNYNKEEYELITEYEADQYACCTGHGRPLISALEKIVKNIFGMNSIYEEVSDPRISHLINNTVTPRIKRIKRYLDS
jgi:Zn-dependent protease with chaperone function